MRYGQRMLGTTESPRADPSWQALQLLEAGRIAEAQAAVSARAPAERAEQPARPHDLALRYLLCRARRDAAGQAEQWWRMLHQPQLDARIFAALASGGEDDLAAAARAVLRWGMPSDRTHIAYGFPSSQSEACPHDFTRFAEVVRARAAQFEERGFVTLRGLLAPSIIGAWHRDIKTCYLRAVAEQPSLATTPFERTLNLEQGGSAAGRGTVRWQRGLVPIPLLSMELAATLDALMGGMDRLVPWMSDYLSFSRYWAKLPRLSDLPSMDRAALGDVLKTALVGVAARLSRPLHDTIIGWSYDRLAWHIDETPERGRLEEQKLGVLGLILLTDVAIQDGPTAFLPESPRLVARSLLEQPGRNQSDSRWTSSIARRCNRRVLATGRAGDVFLVHPLTLHSRVPPQRSSARIIANPNFFAKSPLCYLQPRSPVERHVAQAL